MARKPDQNAEVTAETLLAAASKDVAHEAGRWLTHLSAEAHLSELTLEAYARDVAGFLGFLAGHLGGRPSLAALSKLAPADIRAFLAWRRAAGVESRTLVRTLAAVRSFARFLEREGKGKVAALAAVRAPRVAKGLPKPLSAGSAKAGSDPALRAGEERAPWVLARDASV